MRIPGFPDLLATKWGRMTTFFFLYVTEGIPLGFTATAIATQMRRQGLGVAEIGAFVGSLYLPWAFKWAFGPFVDVISSDRWGRRRMWIVIAQVMMVTTLMATLPVNFTTEIKLFTAMILIVNVFGATQDVAIDALAVGTLKEKERGLANGLMFGGAYLGQTVGGAGVLFLSEKLNNFQLTYFFVAACILLVTIFIALPMREPKGPPEAPIVGSRLKHVGKKILSFVWDAIRAFVGTRGAFIGLIFALLPAGAYALGSALYTNLAVGLGFTDGEIAKLSLITTIIAAVGCVVGGLLSDKLGRKRMLAIYLVGTAIPTLYLAWIMQQNGWIMPVDTTAEDRPVPAPIIVSTFWAMVIVYAVFQGLMYGTRTALFMDVTTPKVAATQFTAYMAMLNFVITYTATWQGLALAKWGYPTTLTIDSIVGLIGISLLPFMVAGKKFITLPDLPARLRPGDAVPDGMPPRR
jgi:PAT family beta-lactamase induction signal transducer AmpG